ncbi:MAG: hypothetical protein ACRERV_03230 [Methylococcales bacterium]
MLLSQVDEHIGLTSAVAAVLHDPRDPDRITHSMEDFGRAAHLRVMHGL